MGFFTAICERKSSLVISLCLLILGSATACYLVPRELTQLHWEVPGTPDEYPLAYSIRPWLIGLACLVPAIIALAYSFMGILDRYMTRNILTTFALTTSVISLIWLLGDFSENVSDITSMDSPVRGMFRLYANQVPMILSLILPYSLLLATLWSLSNLSRHSEITPMLQSGRGLLRITLPIIMVGFFTAGYTTIFNYQWAPSAMLYRRLAFDDITRQKNQNTSPVIYRNKLDNRVWTIRKIPRLKRPQDAFHGIHVEQFSSPGKLNVEYFADTASWDASSREWILTNVTTRVHTEDNLDLPSFLDEGYREKIVRLPFRETPWLLITPGVKVDTRSVPDLMTRLEEPSLNEDRRIFRTHKHLRFAQGFSSFVLVLLAIPGGISFSRRGNLSGIGVALGMSGLMIFGFEVFPTLSSAGYLPPYLGAWLPNIVFLGVAFILFYRKLAHRSIRDLFPGKKDRLKD